MEKQSSGKTIQSVQRAIDIIDCFRSLESELTLAQISDTLHLNKSTVHGIISTLYKNDYLTQTPAGRYKLGPFFYREFGSHTGSLRSVLKAKSLLGMNQLADKYHVSCALFLYEMGELILVNRIQPIGEAYTVTTFATYIQPLYCSASGKLLLASMDEAQLQDYLSVNPLLPRTENTICDTGAFLTALETIREQEYAVEDEELGHGIYSISVPIHDDKQQFFATISASGIVFEVKPKMEMIAEDLKSLAKDLSAQVFPGRSFR